MPAWRTEDKTSIFSRRLPFVQLQFCPHKFLQTFGVMSKIYGYELTYQY